MADYNIIDDTLATLKTLAASAEFWKLPESERIARELLARWRAVPKNVIAAMHLEMDEQTIFLDEGVD